MAPTKRITEHNTSRYWLKDCGEFFNVSFDSPNHAIPGNVSSFDDRSLSSHRSGLGLSSAHVFTIMHENVHQQDLTRALAGSQIIEARLFIVPPNVPVLIEHPIGVSN